MALATDAAAQIAPQGGSFGSPIPGGIRWPDVAYDPVNSVYLAVTGPSSIRGQFIRPDGSFASAPFQINSSAAYAQLPRVFCGPTTGSCLVVWADNRNGYAYPDLYGRIVAVGPTAGPTAAPVFVSADFPVSILGVGVYWENGRPGMGYSTTSHEYMVTWRQLNDAEIHGRMVGDTGALLSNDIRVTTDSFGEDQSAVAWNAATDRFLVGYQGWATGYNFFEATWVQAGAGAGPVGPPMRIYNGALAWGGDAVNNPVSGKTVLLFYVSAGSIPTGIYGQRFNPDGSFDGAPFLVSSYFGNYDAMRTSYNPISNTFALATHSKGSQDAVIELHQDGTPVDNGIVATSIPNGLGNFNPAIAASTTQAQWLLVTSNGFSSLWGQFVQTATREPGGGGPVPSFAKSSPASGTTNVATPFTLAWGAVAGATDYQVCIDAVNNNACDGTWASVGNATSVPVSNASAGTTLYWQVQATVNGQTITADSGTWWNFSTAAAPVVIPFGATSAPNGSWVFAEGAVGLTARFSTFYSLANENASAAHVRGWFVNETSRVITTWETTIAAQTRMTVDLSQIVGGVQGSYSAVFQSVNAGQQVYVGRTMYWGGTAGVLTGPGHLKAAIYVPPGGAPSGLWHFAEGARVTAKGGTSFEDYFMFFNPNQTDATVTVEFLSDNGSGVIASTSHVVPAQGRWTLSASLFPALAGRSFSTRATSNLGLVAERSMYWGTGWSGGHTGFGGTPNPNWYFAEGTAQTAFDSYFLLLNPSASTVSVGVTYHLAPLNGVPQSPVNKAYTIPPNTRKTIYLYDDVGAQGGATAEFHSDGAIVAERSMYWGTSWTEGSTALGAPTPATEWHLPEGSTINGFETYVLLSNPNTSDISINVSTFSSDGLQETVAVPVPAQSRVTVYMNNVDPAKGPVWATIQGKAFSVRTTASGAQLPFVAEEAVYWQQLGAGNYWRGGDATMGIPVIR